MTAGRPQFWVAAAAILTACTDSPSQQEHQGITWVSGPEGSQVASVEHLSIGGSERIRCWPIAGRQDCLFVSWIPGIEFSAWRGEFGKLPTSDERQGAGYGCRFSTQGFALYSESVSNENGTLISRDDIAGGREPAWKRSYVSGYMKANRVQGRPHFDCRRLAELLSKGSIETVGSTTISYRIMD